MKSDLAQSFMLDFAQSTGVVGDAKPRRYLWTDAFAVCNFLGLHRATGEDRFLQLARTLVEQVHHVLGRHREDDARRGWISGLSEEQGERHPTIGGLRIGKKLNERGPHDPFDSQLEWDRDGQYFHYLTKWMHALARVAEETGEPHELRWAGELADTAQRAFTVEGAAGVPQRMVWKMSIDLRRPLVPSMGRHDPLDGLVTALELQTSGEYEACGGPDLSPAIADFSGMCEHGRWATDDPLGIGGLLDTAARLLRMEFDRRVDQPILLRQLLKESEQSLLAFVRSGRLTRPAACRLAFRDLGLAVGLRGLELVTEELQPAGDLAPVIQRLQQYRGLAEKVSTFWSDAPNRGNAMWTGHGDINTVMLATSLAPEGYFGM
ncbi:MAG: hypothetical protein AB7U20_11845 [Planctomycetaceae bacterium]